MTRKKYFGGLEGIIAKLVSLIITVVFFAIYNLTSDKLEASWFELTGILLLFWLIYEILGYVLFLFFVFFGNNRFERIDEEVEEDKDSSEIVTVENLNE